MKGQRNSLPAAGGAVLDATRFERCRTDELGRRKLPSDILSGRWLGPDSPRPPDSPIEIRTFPHLLDLFTKTKSSDNLEPLLLA